MHIHTPCAPLGPIIQIKRLARNSSLLTMKCEVKLYVAGQVFTETVICRNYEEAREVALARNPNAKVLGVTAVFK